MKNFTGFALASALLAVAGCARDTTLPPFHTSIKYDHSRSDTSLSDVPPTDAPSTRDWKTNQVVGVGYGTSGPKTGVSNATGTAAGAASSPSGTNSGAASGVSSGGAGVSSSTAVGSTPGSGTPGTIMGNPPGTGTIGGTPTTPGSSLNTTPFRSGTLTSPGFGEIGVTNRGSGVLFTNTITGQTNFLNRP